MHSVDNVASVGVMHLVPAGWLPASARSGRSRRQCFSVSLSSAIAAVSLSHVKLLWIASEKDQKAIKLQSMQPELKQEEESLYVR